MEFKQLQVFQMAAQESNFTRAAEILNYAQSTVTSQIQSLESELGVALFDRLGKRVILTEQGRRFKAYTDQILTLSNEAKNEFKEDGEPSGTLVICAQETQTTYRLPSLLLEFQRRFPKVQLVFRPGISDSDIRVYLATGQLDAAFLFEPPVDSDSLVIARLCQEPIVIVCHPTNQLTKISDVTAADIEDQTILLTENGCHYRRVFEDTLATNGRRPPTKLELGNVEAIKRCVMAGLGIAALPKIAVEEEVSQGKMAILPWTGCEFDIATQLAWHKDKWLSPALRAFISVTRDALCRQNA